MNNIQERFHWNTIGGLVGTSVCMLVCTYVWGEFHTLADCTVRYKFRVFRAWKPSMDAAAYDPSVSSSSSAGNFECMPPTGKDSTRRSLSFVRLGMNLKIRKIIFEFFDASSDISGHNRNVNSMEKKTFLWVQYLDLVSVECLSYWNSNLDISVRQNIYVLKQEFPKFYFNMFQQQHLFNFSYFCKWLSDLCCNIHAFRVVFFNFIFYLTKTIETEVAQFCNFVLLYCHVFV